MEFDEKRPWPVFEYPKMCCKKENHINAQNIRRNDSTTVPNKPK